MPRLPQQLPYYSNLPHLDKQFEESFKREEKPLVTQITKWSAKVDSLRELVDVRQSEYESSLTNKFVTETQKDQYYDMLLYTMRNFEKAKVAKATAKRDYYKHLLSLWGENQPTTDERDIYVELHVAVNHEMDELFFWERCLTSWPSDDLLRLV